MPIKITSLSIISNEDIEDIIYNYNKNKPVNWEELRALYTKELTLCGFKLQQSTFAKRSTYVENEFKQIRFYGKYLTAYNNYPPFTAEEEQLLFTVMRIILGKDNVNYYKTFSSAVSYSPTTNITLINIKKSPAAQLSSSPSQCLTNVSVSPKVITRWLPI
jgi:hypothetical protein